MFHLWAPIIHILNDYSFPLTQTQLHSLLTFIILAKFKNKHLVEIQKLSLNLAQSKLKILPNSHKEVVIFIVKTIMDTNAVDKANEIQ